MYKSLVALRAGSLQILEARKLIQLAQIKKIPFFFYVENQISLNVNPKHLKFQI